MCNVKVIIISPSAEVLPIQRQLRQKEAGLAMGSLSSAITAKICIQSLLKHALESIIPESSTMFISFTAKI
jgi:hypothetical protein